MPQPHGCSDGFPHLSECDCAPGRKSTSFHDSRPWGNSPPKGFYRFSWGVSRQEEGPHLAIPVLCSSEDSPFVGPLNTEVLFEEKMRSDDDLCGNVTLCGLVAQPCLILCDPTDCSPTRLLCPRNSPGKNTGVDCHSLLQRNFPTQGSSPGFLHCRQILYRLSYREVCENIIRYKALG